MGRGPENEFVIPDPLASRVHARIEYRRDRFLLIDQSLNGTYVQMHGGPSGAAPGRDRLGLVGADQSRQVYGGPAAACVRFRVQRGGQVAERALLRKRAVR